MCEKLLIWIHYQRQHLFYSFMKHNSNLQWINNPLCDVTPVHASQTTIMQKICILLKAERTQNRTPVKNLFPLRNDISIQSSQTLSLERSPQRISSHLQIFADGSADDCRGTANSGFIPAALCQPRPFRLMRMCPWGELTKHFITS